MGELIPFKSLTDRVKVRDYLEPKEQGLFIATDNPSYGSLKSLTSDFNGKVYMWWIGKPRKIYSQYSPLWELVNHNENLLTITFPDHREKFSIEEIGPEGIYVKNIITGGVEVPNHIKSLCSYNGGLYGIKEDYHPENIHKKAFTNSILCKVNRDKSLEELVTKRAKVEAMIEGPEGIVASMMAEPRAEGPHTIVNLTKDEILYSEPLRYDGYDLGEIETLCFIGNDLIFPRYPYGIYNQDKKLVAEFPLLRWISKRLREIQFSDKDEVRRVREDIEMEKIAGKHLGYSYWKAMKDWSTKEAKEKKDTDWFKRIAMHKFFEERFNIRHMAYLNGHIILAAKHNLYVAPFLGNEYRPVSIHPFNNLIWTFKDNIKGLAVVREEDLRKLRGNANMRMGRRMKNSLATSKLRAVA